MHSIVKNAFLTIMISMVMFIIVGVTLYIARMYSMKHKIDAIVSDMRQDVIKNHYLPSTSYDMYDKMLKQVQADDPNLIASIDLNYDHPAQDGVANFDIPDEVSVNGKQLSMVSNIGDMKVIQIKVVVHRISWGSEQHSGAITTANDLKSGWVYGEEYFNTLVPCQRYIK